MLSLTSHYLLNSPPANIQEANIKELQIQPISFLENKEWGTAKYNNYLIDKYYTNTTYCINFNDKKYNKFTNVHTITSKNEQELYKAINYIPLTKKYFYKFNTITEIITNDTSYDIKLIIDLYKLLYNETLYNNFLNNKYCEDNTYINTLSFYKSINVNIKLLSNSFINNTDFTNYINTDFTADLINHLNTILFNDIYFYIHNKYVTNDIEIISEKYCNTAFNITLDGTNYYNENNFKYNITLDILNKKDSTNVNLIELSKYQVILQENLIYTLTHLTDEYYNERYYIYKLAITNNLLTLDKNQFYNKYYYLFFSNIQFYNSYNFFKSIKLSQHLNSPTTYIYTHKYFNNNYFTDETVYTNYNLINLYIKSKNITLQVDTFGYKILSEKLKKEFIIPTSNNSYYLSFLKNQFNYNIIDNNTNDTSHIITDTSMNIPIQHTQKDIVANDEYQQDTNSVSQNIIYFKNIDYICRKIKPNNINLVFDDFNIIKQYKSPYYNYFEYANNPCYTHSSHCEVNLPESANLTQYNEDPYNNYMKLSLAPYNCYTNTTIPISIKINPNNNQVNTIIFITGNTGQFTNEFKIGDYQHLKNNGNIILFNDETSTSNNIIFNIPMNNQINESKLLLHILELDINKKVTYTIYSQDNTLVNCSFDLTNINDLNMSILQLSSIRHKTFYPPVNIDNFSSTFTDQYNTIKSFEKQEPQTSDVQSFEINLYELYKTNFYNSNFNNLNNIDIDNYLPNLKHLDFDNYKYLLFQIPCERANSDIHRLFMRIYTNIDQNIFSNTDNPIFPNIGYSFDQQYFNHPFGAVECNLVDYKNISHNISNSVHMQQLTLQAVNYGAQVALRFKKDNILNQLNESEIEPILSQSRLLFSKYNYNRYYSPYQYTPAKVLDGNSVQFNSSSSYTDMIFNNRKVKYDFIFDKFQLFNKILLKWQKDDIVKMFKQNKTEHIFFLYK